MQRPLSLAFLSLRRKVKAVFPETITDSDHGIWEHGFQGKSHLNIRGDSSPNGKTIGDTMLRAMLNGLSGGATKGSDRRNPADKGLDFLG